MAQGSRNKGTASPIQRRNLGSDVYRILRDRILRQELHAGDKLSDLHLSAELGVSRTPIREALLQLVRDGVVVAEPNRGFFVATFSARDIQEIFDLRAALETYALRHLATTDYREELDQALFELEHVERLIANADTDELREEAAEAFLKTDRGFHSWLVSKAGNSRLSSIITDVWAQVSIFQQAGAELPGWMEIALSQHRAIIERLRDDDVDGAIDALDAHIRDMKTRVLEDLTDLANGSGEGNDEPAE